MTEYPQLEQQWTSMPPVWVQGSNHLHEPAMCAMVFCHSSSPSPKDLAGTGAGGQGHWSKCNGKRVPMREKLLPSCFPNIDVEHPPFCRGFFRTGHHGFSTSFWTSLPWRRCLNRYNIGICLIHAFRPLLTRVHSVSSVTVAKPG